MFKTLILLYLVFFIHGCGQKKSVEAEFVISFGALTDNSALSGGVIIYGHNSTVTQRFSQVITSSNFNIELDNGDWNFYALSWSGPNKLKGELKCAHSFVKLNGEPTTIPLNVSSSSCNSDKFSADTFRENGLIQELKLQSCTDINNTQSCTSGLHRSFRIVLTSYDKSSTTYRTEASEKLISECISNPNYTDIRLPTGSPVLAIGTEIHAFVDQSCTSSLKNIFSFPRGLTQSSLSNVKILDDPGSPDHTKIFLKSEFNVTQPTLSYSPHSGSNGGTINISPTTIDIGGATSGTCSASLPNGLSIHPSTCIISGTISADLSQTVTLTTSDGLSTTANVTITVNSYTTPEGTTAANTLNLIYPFSHLYLTVGTYTEIAPIINNGGSNISSCTTTPDLPYGLQINGITCVIYGTPLSQMDSTPYVVRVNSANNSGTANMTIVISPAQSSGGITPSTNTELSPTNAYTLNLNGNFTLGDYLKVFSDPNCSQQLLGTSYITNSNTSASVQLLFPSSGQFNLYVKQLNSNGTSASCIYLKQHTVQMTVYGTPTPPNNLLYLNPSSTQGIDSTPEVIVNGVSNGDKVFLFNDSYCSYPIGHSTSTANNVIIPVSRSLSQNYHSFYATRSNTFGTSDCSYVGYYQVIPCPEGFIPVPHNTSVGTTKDFCVMKYEAKAFNTGTQTIDSDGCNEPSCSTIGWGVYDHSPVSLPNGHPWRMISLTNADGACHKLNQPAGTNKFDLISNKEWMTIARNAENESSNWTTSVGYGLMARGWSAYSTENGDTWSNQAVAPFTGSNCKFNIGADQCGQSGSLIYRRTLLLSNGEEIWDLSGNLAEWVDWNTTTNIGSHLGPSTCHNSWVDFTSVINDQCYGFALLQNDLLPSTSNGSSREGLGQFSGGQGGAATRGGSWDSGSFAGAYTLNLGNLNGLSTMDIGFRCVYRP